MGVFDYVRREQPAAQPQAQQNTESGADVFSRELVLIDNADLREAVQCALEHAPSYFWEMPASSTGKYHPAYTLGAGGLVRHTKAAVRIADALLRLEMYAPLAARKDEIIAALILHDSVKKGASGGQYTTIEHPLAAADHFQRIAQGLEYKGDIEFICGLIRAHMGQWNKDFDGNDVLPKPITPHQQFVHLCDYLASRKFITITEDSGAPLK